ncbi:MAG: ATPase domain-containing protein [archaeon]
MRISTGIEILDKMLDGGIRQGSSAIIMATPGVEDIQFAHQCFYTHLEGKGSGIYMVNNKRPSIVKAVLNKYDWDVTQFEKTGKCTFIDAYSGLMSIGSEEANYIQKPTDLKGMNRMISKILKKTSGPRIFLLDSLSSLIDITDKEDDVVSFIEELGSTLKESKTTLICLFTQWPYKISTIKSIENAFDCVIRLKAIEQKVILRSYFTVDKASWMKPTERLEVPYKIISPGGVKVFIPKILVTGPFNAGKTSFIHSASTKAVSVDRLGTTIALDHGHVDFKGFSMDLFGTPGQERFDPLMEMLGGEALGVIVVVDSTDPKGFTRAKDMLELTKTEGLPAVIVANKADLKGALSPKDIKKRMNLPEDVPIVPVSAEDLNSVKKDEPCKLKEEDVRKVLERLFEVII